MSTPTPRAWLPPIGGLPRAYWYLWAGMLINRIGGFVVPFLALYLTGVRHLSVAATGLIVSLWGIGSVASGPVGGVLSDRLGRRVVLLAGGVLGAAAMLHLGVARSPAHIAVAALLLGFCADLIRPPLQAAIADLVPPEDRVRAYSFLYWAGNLGFSIASILAGAVAGRSYSLLFVADAATTLAFALLVYLRVPETHPGRGLHASAEAARAPSVSRLLAPYRDGVFVAFIVLLCLVNLVFHQGFVALPIDMGAHGTSPLAFGATIALNGVMIVFLQPFAVQLEPRFDRTHLLAFGALVTGVGFAVTAAASTVPMYAVSIAIWTVGEIAMSVVAPAMVADLSPTDLRGSYQGAMHIAFAAASFLAPALGAFVLGRCGGRVLWPACFVLGAAAAVGHLACAPSRRRRFALVHAAAAAAASPVVAD